MGGLTGLTGLKIEGSLYTVLAGYQTLDSNLSKNNYHLCSTCTICIVTEKKTIFKALFENVPTLMA